jgi:hypothetical protein
VDRCGGLSRIGVLGILGVLGIRLAHVGDAVNHRVAMVAHGQQETTFQVFDRNLEFDATPRCFTTDSTGDILP